MVRKGGQNIVPSTDLVLASGDGLLVVADEQEAIAAAAARLGKLEPGRIVKDRSALDYIRVFRLEGELWSGCRWRTCRCRPAFRPTCCMSGATTWTSFQPPI